MTHFSVAQGKQQTAGKIEGGTSSNGAPRKPAMDGPAPRLPLASGCHVFTSRLAATNACRGICDLIAVIGVTEFVAYY